MITTILLRRDTAANWTSVNPVLHSGELGIETDTHLAKLGNGSTAWSGLPYWSPSALYLALTGGTLSGALAGAVVRLTDMAVIAVDAALGNDFRVTIGGNRTIATPTSPADGQLIMFDITQGAGGPWSVTWDTGYSFGSASQPQLSIAAGNTDLVGFKYNADKGKWLYTGALTGY